MGSSPSKLNPACWVLVPFLLTGSVPLRKAFNISKIMFFSAKWAYFLLDPKIIGRLRYRGKCRSVFGKRKATKTLARFSLPQTSIFKCLHSVCSEYSLYCQRRSVCVSLHLDCHHYWNRRGVHAWPWRLEEHLPSYIRVHTKLPLVLCERGGVPHPKSQDTL